MLTERLTILLKPTEWILLIVTLHLLWNSFTELLVLLPQNFLNFGVVVFTEQNTVLFYIVQEHIKRASQPSPWNLNLPGKLGGVDITATWVSIQDCSKNIAEFIFFYSKWVTWTTMITLVQYLFLCYSSKKKRKLIMITF